MATAGAAVNPADYDAWYDSTRGRWIGDTEYLLLLALLAPRPDARLLDVGCGTGWFTRRFARLPGLDVVGADINDESLTFARRRDQDTSYVHADALALPFAASSFDYVVSVAALGFISDWPRAMAEMVRVARERVVVGVLNRHSVLWWEKGRHGGSGGYRGVYWHAAYELRRALVGCGLRHVRIRSAVFLPNGSGAAYLLEQCVPDAVLYGAFLVGVGEK